MSRLQLWAMIGRLPLVMVKDLECGSSGLLPTLLTLYSLRCLTTDDGSLIGERVIRFLNLTRQFGDAAIHARGSNIKGIRVVINYDFTTGVEGYVHRIGRTGRAGAADLAYTFFGDQDAKSAIDLIKIWKGLISASLQRFVN
ncbi:hypothetical protein ACFX2H_008908 [Malus domestica]